MADIDLSTLGSVIKTAYEGEADTNEFSDAEQTLLGNQSGSNTGDQTNISGNAATVTTNADLTGPVSSSGNATTLEGGRDFALSDETSDLTTGTKLTWYAPYAVTLTLVYTSVTDAPTDATLIVDIHLNGTTIMTTDKIEIETTEVHSSDAGTQPTLTTTAVAQFDKVEMIIDQIGSSDAGTGLKCYLLWTRTA
jgi:hypothetical protein